MDRFSHLPALPGRHRSPIAVGPIAPRCNPAAPPWIRPGPAVLVAVGWGTGAVGQGACPSNRRSRTWRALLRTVPSYPAFSTLSTCDFGWTGSGIGGIPPRSSGLRGIIYIRGLTVSVASRFDVFGCVSNSLPDRCHLDSLHWRPCSWKGRGRKGLWLVEKYSACGLVSFCVLIISHMDVLARNNCRVFYL